MQLSVLGFQVVYPMACGPGSQELSNSGKAGKLFTLSFSYTLQVASFTVRTAQSLDLEGEEGRASGC